MPLCQQSRALPRFITHTAQVLITVDSK